MDTRLLAGSPLHLLERSDVGVVQFDSRFAVVAMNSFARRVLPVEDPQPFEQFEKMVRPFHPECPAANPPPMTMVIHIAERVLWVKVAQLADLRGETAGYTLVLHDVTEAVSGEAPAMARPQARRRLHKIPTVAQNRIVLVDADAVAYVRAEGHYTWVRTAQGASFCNLNITHLAERLDGASFLRIHRSYLANLAFAEQVVRDDGRTSLKLRGDGTALPVARASVPRLLERLGISAG